MSSAEHTLDVITVPRERRRFARVKLSVPGRYMLQDRREFPCETLDIGPGGLGLAVSVPGEIGSRVVVYLERLGRIEGSVVRNSDNVLAMEIIAPQRKRDKLTAQLAWLVDRQADSLPEDRRHERIELMNASCVMTFPQGRRVPVTVVDCSISGAALECDQAVPLGTEVTVGRREARVLRHFDGGIAVEFREPITTERFSLDFAL